jgi:hypothetical protein
MSAPKAIPEATLSKRPQDGPIATRSTISGFGSGATRTGAYDKACEVRSGIVGNRDKEIDGGELKISAAAASSARHETMADVTIIRLSDAGGSTF